MIRRILLGLLGPCLLASSCASPLGGDDLELGVGASGLPGAGILLSASQRMWSSGSRRLDLEFDWTRQAIERGRRPGRRAGNHLDQIRLGLRGRWPSEAASRWTARAGVAWMRALGDPKFLDAPSDYGGVYVGIGYEWELGEHLVTGPDLTVHALDSEGIGDTGVVPELAWRLAWRL